jgi:SAM-dependent methyltransferase
MTEFDAYRDGYEGRINDAISYTGKSRNFFTKVKADYLLDLFMGHFGRGSDPEILDIGCGNAIIHQFLSSRWPELRLSGIDIAASVIDEARASNPQVNYNTYDGAGLPYTDGRFSGAYTICVMHHVPPSGWREFLVEMRRVVRPGGLVAVIEHNPLNPLTRRLVATCPFDRNAVLIRAGRLAELMREAGLHDVWHRSILFTPFDGSFFQRFDRALGWLPLGAQYLAAGRVPD